MLLVHMRVVSLHYSLLSGSRSLATVQRWKPVAGVLAGFGGALMPRAQVSEAWREHPNMAPFLHGPGRASTSVLCPSYTRSVLGSGSTAGVR